MSEDLVFYTNPMSRGRIARWMLEETGATYRTEILDYGGAIKAPDYLAINPMGKVPCIVHGGAVVTETAAICAYLADAFPGARLAPPPAARGAYYRWLFFAAGPLEQALVNKAMGFETPEDKRQMAGYDTWDTAVRALDTAIPDDGFITGAEFTAADVYVGSHIGWGMMFGSLPKTERFERYFALVSDRDAYRKAQEIDDALMPPGAG